METIDLAGLASAVSDATGLSGGALLVLVLVAAALVLGVATIYRRGRRGRR